MGIAAYNRGSAVLERQLDGASRPQEFAVMDNMNAYSRQGAVRPFGPVRIFYDNAQGVWWIIDAENEDKHGFYYPSLKALFASWNVLVTEYDETTDRWYAVPWPEEKQ